MSLSGAGGLAGTMARDERGGLYAIRRILKIETVKGESADAKHKGEIDILNYRWGVKNKYHRWHRNQWRRRGEAQFNELVITKRIDAASPLLFKACASGQHFQLLTLVIREAGGKQLET